MSSARRERCVASVGQRVQIIEREIAIAHGVQAIGGDAAQSPARAPWPRGPAEMPNRPARPRPAGRRRPSCAPPPAARGRGRNASACASRKCENSSGCACCRCVMPGHGHAHGALGKTGQRRDQPAHRGGRLPRGILHEQTKIRRHQFVAAARRVQLVAQRAQPLDQRDLDEVVHVLGRRALRPTPDPSRRARRSNRSPPASAAARRRSECPRGDGARPGAVHRQLVRQQPPVERQRALKLVEKLVRRAIEPPAPELVRAADLPASPAGLALAFTLSLARGSRRGVAVAVTGSAIRLMKPCASFWS